MVVSRTATCFSFSASVCWRASSSFLINSRDERSSATSTNSFLSSRSFDWTSRSFLSSPVSFFETFSSREARLFNLFSSPRC